MVARYPSRNGPFTIDDLVATPEIQGLSNPIVCFSLVSNWVSQQGKWNVGGEGYTEDCLWWEVVKALKEPPTVCKQKAEQKCFSLNRFTGGRKVKEAAVVPPPEINLTHIRFGYHLVFAEPGAGKTKHAYELAKAGHVVIIACHSNVQAEKKFREFDGLKQKCIARCHYFAKRFGYKPMLHPSDDEDDVSTGIWKAKTYKLMVDKGTATNKRHAQDLFAEVSRDGPPNLEKGQIIFTTHDRTRVWIKALKVRNYLQKTFAGSLKKKILFFDDIGWRQIPRQIAIAMATSVLSSPSLFCCTRARVRIDLASTRCPSSTKTGRRWLMK